MTSKLSASIEVEGDQALDLLGVAMPVHHSLSLRFLQACVSWIGVLWIGLFGNLDGRPLGRATAGESQIAVSEVVGAWRKREAAVATVRIRWHEHRSYAPESLLSKMEVRAAHGVPAEKMTVDFPCELLKKGEYLRYSACNARVRKDLTVAFVPYVSSYDGSESRMLSQVSESEYHGVQRTEERNTDAPSYPLKPLQLAFAPESAAFGHESFRVVNSDENVLSDDLKPLLALSSNIYRVWCDVDKGMQITRWQKVSKDQGAVLLQVDLNYEKDEAGEWRPSQWVLQRFRKSSISETYTGVVTSCEIGLPLTRADFRLDFPVGTKGHDETNKTDFAILKDGSKRVLSGKELSLTPTELDELPRSIQGSSRFGWTLFFVGLSGISGFMLLKVLQNRRMKRSRDVRSKSL